VVLLLVILVLVYLTQYKEKNEEEMEIKYYCLGYVFNEDLSKVFLLDINKPGKFGHGLINGLGGKLNPMETSEEAMSREFSEEGGLLISKWNSLGVYSGYNNEISSYYNVDCYTSIIKEQDLPEFNGPEGLCKWYDLDNLPKNLSSNVEMSLYFAQKYFKNPLLKFNIYNGI
jgi:8-oxo-dGTP pyrophosphatase MutT (NUDIX family)